MHSLDLSVLRVTLTVDYGVRICQLPGWEIDVISLQHYYKMLCKKRGQVTKLHLFQLKFEEHHLKFTVNQKHF